MKAVTWHGKRDVRVDAPRAYEQFQKKQDGMIKAVLQPA